VAGSLRRHKEFVGDIEIVIIPKITEIRNMFGEVTASGALDLDAVIKKWNKPMIRSGMMSKQIDFGNICLDLFIVTRAKWGVVFTIRTGCAEFSHWLVTKRSMGGAMPSNMQTKDGILHIDGEPVETFEEADLFKAIDVKYIQPERRTQAFWQSKEYFI
jgi:DNA polymerase/3'-5' exonuclease PolX